MTSDPADELTTSVMTSGEILLLQLVNIERAKASSDEHPVEQIPMPGDAVKEQQSESLLVKRDRARAERLAKQKQDTTADD